jgi:CDP-diacylglycerol--glycerol-3-phosphate 3-phosphatidyltransferase
VLWFIGEGDSTWGAGLALACLVLGAIVPYARARAEGLGMTAQVGIAERADRLAAVLVATALVGVGVPQIVLVVVLGLLAVASFVTVIQRMVVVRRQAVDAA